MSYSLVSQRRVQSIKPHKCDWCGMIIPKGTRYVREKSTYDGYWQDSAWHEACRKHSYEHFRYAEEFEPLEMDNPFPCLTALDASLDH